MTFHFETPEWVAWLFAVWVVLRLIETGLTVRKHYLERKRLRLLSRTGRVAPEAAAMFDRKNR